MNNNDIIYITQNRHNIYIYIYIYGLDKETNPNSDSLPLKGARGRGHSMTLLRPISFMHPSGKNRSSPTKMATKLNNKKILPKV